MLADTLIDTGAILAILDKSHEWHPICRAVFRQLPLPLLTSEAVLTEVFHMVGDSPSRMEATWVFVRSGALMVAAIEHSELPHLHRLMSRYAACPMDFADATLVYLAERHSIQTILTVDHRDFAIYRIAGKRRFRILPVEHP